MRPAVTRAPEPSSLPAFDILLPPFIAGSTMSRSPSRRERQPGVPDPARIADGLEQMATQVRAQGLQALVDGPGADELWQDIAHVLRHITERDVI